MNWPKLQLSEPSPGVPYHRALATKDAYLPRSLVGVMTSILVFVLIIPVLTQVFIGLGWLITGSPGDFETFYRQSMAFETPTGMVAVHLGIASLTLVSMGAVALLHRVSPRWLASVQPGVRWRYLGLAMGIAVVVLNGALWLSRLDVPWAPRFSSEMWVFLIVILVTSPLQALGEEVFFRGYLMQAFGSMVASQWFAIVTSALVFALFHGIQNPPLFLNRFAFGVLAGLLVVKTGGLEAAVAAHVVNNVFAFGYAAIETSVAEAKAIQQIGWVDAAFDIAGFAVFAVVAFLLARRMNLATTTPA